jgi:hypothetical protein
MKNISLVILAFIAFVSCNQTPVNTEIINSQKMESISVNDTISGEIVFNFDNNEIGKLPQNWVQAFTGRGNGTEWKIVDDNGNKVMAQLSSDNPNYHFNIVVNNEISVKNVILKVKLKGIAGKMDQGGGFVWRYTDANNYYVVRANPLEDNVVLYKVIDGKRTDLPVLGKGRTYGVDVDKLGNDWNTLALKVTDDLFTVFLNNKELFKVKDQSIKNAGKIGFWTKADAVTYFDAFEIRY